MGLFALVLHTHLPYVRRNGTWPSGEDFFHQAAVESYLPTLGVLRRLADRGMRDVLTVGITPLAAHQMEDPYMRRELELYLGRWELRALRQVTAYEGPHRDAVRDLAAAYALFGRRQAALLDEVGGRIARAYAEVERAGAIEILGGPASHAHLPLVTEPALLEAQIAHGLAEHRRLIGSRPRGVWLPECAYRPDTDPPIEEALARGGVSHLVVDGPTMIRSDGRGATFRPRWVGGAPVAAFARNLEVTYRVWSPTSGYPGNKWYRAFHHTDSVAGFKNLRVTTKQTPDDRKRPYEPERGTARARADAEDFAAAIARALEAYEREAGEEGLVVACFDTELFGHWWFEGPVFLEALYEILSRHPSVRPVTLAKALEMLPPTRRVPLVEGSWGFRKDNRSWVAPETEDMRRSLSEVESETVRLAAKLADADGAKGVARDQLVREAFLLQSSDWPFMVLRGRNAGYARERFFGHRSRWDRLADLLLRHAPDAVIAREAGALFEIDNAFPALSGADLQRSS